MSDWSSYKNQKVYTDQWRLFLSESDEAELILESGLINENNLQRFVNLMKGKIELIKRNFNNPDEAERLRAEIDQIQDQILRAKAELEVQNYTDDDFDEIRRLERTIAELESLLDRKLNPQAQNNAQGADDSIQRKAEREAYGKQIKDTYEKGIDTSNRPMDFQVATNMNEATKQVERLVTSKSYYEFVARYKLLINWYVHVLTQQKKNSNFLKDIDKITEEATKEFQKVRDAGAYAKRVNRPNIAKRLSAIYEKAATKLTDFGFPKFKIPIQRQYIALMYETGQRTTEKTPEKPPEEQPEAEPEAETEQIEVKKCYLQDLDAFLADEEVKLVYGKDEKYNGDIETFKRDLPPFVNFICGFISDEFINENLYLFEDERVVNTEFTKMAARSDLLRTKAGNKAMNMHNAFRAIKSEEDKSAIERMTKAITSTNDRISRFIWAIVNVGKLKQGTETVTREKEKPKEDTRNFSIQNDQEFMDSEIIKSSIQNKWKGNVEGFKKDFGHFLDFIGPFILRFKAQQDLQEKINRRKISKKMQRQKLNPAFDALSLSLTGKKNLRQVMTNRLNQMDQTAKAGVYRTINFLASDSSSAKELIDLIIKSGLNTIKGKSLEDSDLEAMTPDEEPAATQAEEPTPAEEPEEEQAEIPEEEAEYSIVDDNAFVMNGVINGIMKNETYSGKSQLFIKDFKVLLNLIAPYIRQFDPDLIKEGKKKSQKKNTPKGTEQKLSNLGTAVPFLKTPTSKGQKLRQDYNRMSPADKLSIDRFINSLSDKPKELAALFKFIVERAKIQRTRKKQEEPNEAE